MCCSLAEGMSGAACENGQCVCLDVGVTSTYTLWSELVKWPGPVSCRLTRLQAQVAPRNQHVSVSAECDTGLGSEHVDLCNSLYHA